MFLFAGTEFEDVGGGITDLEGGFDDESSAVACSLAASSSATFDDWEGSGVGGREG